MKAADTFAEVTTLLDAGVPLKDAIPQVAAANGKTAGSVRANYYNHRKRLGDSPAGPRTTSLSPSEAIDAAKRLLVQALVGVDEHVAKARAEAEAAQQRYEEAAAAAEQRRAELQQRIAAL